MIKSSLGKVAPNIAEILHTLNLDQSLRAENLSPQDYINIAKAV
jgi:16S rRNA A1518/A1519 N6-dimethyltransferase RsmA/KsgA/DIM1 with predicted DNA glycosylase/AP lyase activity